MNFRISSKTRVVQPLLEAQKMIELYTEYVNSEKTALETSRGEPIHHLKETYLADIKILKTYKTNFNNILRSIKPYEVG